MRASQSVLKDKAIKEDMKDPLAAPGLAPTPPPPPPWVEALQASQVRIEHLLEDIERTQRSFLLASTPGQSPAQALKRRRSGTISPSGLGPDRRGSECFSDAAEVLSQSHAGNANDDVALCMGVVNDDIVSPSSSGVPDSPNRQNRAGHALSVSEDFDDLILTAANVSLSETPAGEGRDLPAALPASLPSDWPKSLTMRRVRKGQKIASTKTYGMSNSGTDVSMGNNLTSRQDEEEIALLVDQEVEKPFLILDPNTYQHALWDMLGIVLLGFDLLLIPYILSWEVKVSGALLACAMSVALYWTIDIGVCFMTAYTEPYEGGTPNLITHQFKIVIHYIRTWFFLDISLVTLDWVTIAIALTSSSDDGFEVLRLLRLTKIGRGLRTLGMLRTVHVMRRLEARLEGLSDTSSLVVQVLRMAAGILLSAHIITCGWFALGTSIPTDTGLRWTDIYLFAGEETVPFLETPKIFQYITAFNWTMAQLTLGSIWINSVSTPEVIYTVICILLGLLLGTTLISSLSAALVDSSMSHREANEKRRTLRRYLRENVGRNPMLVNSVLQQFQEVTGQQRRLTEDKVLALEVISDNLRTHIRYESFKPHLYTYPFNRCWDRFESHSFRRACMESMELLFRHTGENLFSAGASAEVVYYVASGNLQYIQRPDTAPVRVRTVSFVHSQSWLSEAALWANWIHVGGANVASMGQILSVRVARLWSSIQSRQMNDLLREYASGFHERLVSSMPPHSTWPSDIHVPYTDFADIMRTMPETLQEQISEEALAQMGRTFFSGYQDKLRQEVKRGKSMVIVGGDGAVLRSVALVAVHAVNEDGKLLVQLGSWDTKEKILASKCQLPGAKQERGELPRDTLQRILTTRLWPMAEYMSVISGDRETTMQYSKDYGLFTQYLKTVVKMKVVDETRMIGGELIHFTTASINAALYEKQGTQMGLIDPARPSHRPWSCFRWPMQRGPPMGASISVRKSGDRLARLLQQPVYPIREKDSKLVSLMTWLPEGEFQELNKDEELVSAWVATFRSHFLKRNFEDQTMKRSSEGSDADVSAGSEDGATRSGGLGGYGSHVPPLQEDRSPRGVRHRLGSQDDAGASGGDDVVSLYI